MQNQQGIQNYQMAPNPQFVQSQQIMSNQQTFNQPEYQNQSVQYQPGMQTQPVIKNQQHEYNPTFPVVYKKLRFMVDPILLCQTSRKFKELYEPINNGNYKFGPMQLEIACNNFSERNVDNFLKICQNLPNDVQDSETEEICELAKLFQADRIYDSGISFIQQAVDPHFYVPENKYEETNDLKYLYIEPEGNSLHQTENMNELQYNLLTSQNEAAQQPVTSGYININTVPSTNNLNISRANSRNVMNSSQMSSTNFNNENENENNKSSQKIESKNISSKSSTNNLYNETGNDVTASNKSIDINQKEENSTNNENKSDNKPEDNHVTHSVVYQIKIDVPLWKCNRFFFIKDGEVLFTAKQKNEYIVIGKGSDVHISKDTSNHVAHIIQNEDYYNDVSVEDQKFIVKYVSLGKTGHFSIELSFKHNGNTYYWGPRDTYNNMKNYGYTLKLAGEYHHHPIRSRKNAVLQNPDGQTTFIVRKMDENFFEVECHPDVPLTIAFVIALSNIVGPYYDFDGQFNF